MSFPTILEGILGKEQQIRIQAESEEKNDKERTCREKNIYEMDLEGGDG